MTRTRSERPQWRQRIYQHCGDYLVVTASGLCWMFICSWGWKERYVSRSFAASLLRDWRKGGAR